MKMALQEKKNTKSLTYMENKRGEAKGSFWRVYVPMNGEFMGQTGS